MTAPLQLPLVDRSRYEDGVGHCQRSRYLQYHAGGHGYGWAPKAQSVPLVTGIMLAGIQEWIHKCLLTNPYLPAEHDYYHHAIQPALAAYRATVDARGLSNILPADDLQLRVNEQLTLLEGLAWVWYYVALPEILKDWKIVAVEAEHTSVLGCTCGLGDRIGTAEEHDARACQGFGYMTRGDFVCQHRTVANRYSYHECKAPGETNKNTDAAWEYRVQLLGGVWGYEDTAGVSIDEIWLHQSIKGKRQPEYEAATKGYTGPKYQNSTLVYAYYRPGNPPLAQEEWRKKEGQKPSGFQRRPVWEITDYEGALSPVHYWVQWLGREELLGNYRPIGPIQRNDVRADEFARQLIGEEQRWIAKLWDLYTHTEQTGEAWGDPGFMDLLDRLIPQTRGQACASYYGELCMGVKLCDRHAGWEAPELLNYIARRPHHLPELLQGQARGLIAPDEGLADEGEE